jgi:hypothetical protein
VNTIKPHLNNRLFKIDRDIFNFSIFSDDKVIGDLVPVP